METNQKKQYTEKYVLYNSTDNSVVIDKHNKTMLFDTKEEAESE